LKLFGLLNAYVSTVDVYARKYDTETLVTRMLLKGMIEYLSNTVHPSALDAAMSQLEQANFAGARKSV